MIRVILVLFTSAGMGAFGQDGWQRVSSLVHDGLHDVFFLNDSLGWAYTYGTGAVIHICDGGQNWEEVQMTQNRLRSIAFIDEKVGFVVGDHNAEDGVLYRSDEGGLTWEKCKTNYPDLHRLFVAPEKTWIVGKEETILFRNNDNVR